MKFRLPGLIVSYDADTRASLKRAICNKLGIYSKQLISFKPSRRAIDSRKKPVKLVYTADIETKGEVSIKGILAPAVVEELTYSHGSTPLSTRPVIVGAGPAGMFAAYLLAKHGFRPILLERGGTISQRKKALQQFALTRNPNPECNALFGIGGAGTFSDGKLTTSASHPIIAAILQTLVTCGAPEEILTDAKPHIGTDVLGNVVEHLLRDIQSLGGECRTDVQFNGLTARHGTLQHIATSDGVIQTQTLILAIGHSARDTLKSLEKSGLEISPKPFQLGVRVEHPQGWLDQQRYDSAAGHPSLGAADYKLTTRVGKTPVFSFCMCPGGQTMPTINEAEHLCVNGMSYHARNSPYSSSGIVVTIHPEDFGASTMNDCIQFVRRIESNCFHAGGANYQAPAQKITSFLEDKKDSSLPDNSYNFGLTNSRLSEHLPPIVVQPILKALPTFHRKLPGFIHPEGVVIAPEARASSPIRINRDSSTRESTRVSGVYPTGEGAGYAGGIMSSALDGIHAAIRIIEKYDPGQME